MPFVVARRVALFAGIRAGCLWITRRSVQPFSMSVLDQADNPRRLVAHDDDSVVRSCAYPYATVLSGMPWRVQGNRLLRPLHKMESQSRSWGVCITSASGGEELHLYSTQVIKDLSSLDPSSLAHVPFRGNGSQHHRVPRLALPAPRDGPRCPLVLPLLASCTHRCSRQRGTAPFV